MDCLRPNPVGCLQFERNIFKREKCRHCGHPWNLHAGAISEADFRMLAAAGQRQAQDRAAAEADARARASAAAREKKRNTRAVEDDWLFDDASHGVSESNSGDSDGDGFHMFSGQDLARAPIARTSAGSSSGGLRPLRIRNLVDFDECNVLPGAEAPGRGSAEARPSRGPCPPERPPAPPVPAPAPQACPAGAWPAPAQEQWCGFSTPMQSKDDVLLEEIRYLRQMLADANEEKSIQVAIVRDEVAEKQRSIEELTRRRADAEASLRALRKELEQRAERGGSDPRGPEAAGAEAPSRHQAWAAEHEGLHLLLDQQHLELDKRTEELFASQDRERELHAECQDLKERLRGLKENTAERLCELEVRNEVLASRLAAREEEAARLPAVEAELAAREAELRELRARLVRREAPGDAVAACKSEAEARAWEGELRECSQLALERLADRRADLRVAALLDAHDTALCKICYDRPASCALLPCRHHAFCKSCARRVESSSDSACPICRRKVSGRFETFAS